MDLIKIENLSFTYPLSEKKALDHISLTIEKGSFTLLTGYTGSGKSTLLKLLKKEISPHGEKTGEITFPGFSEEIRPSDIGCVYQNPDEQIVTDKVWHELSFGLENMGLSKTEVRLKTGEAASYFGLTSLFEENTERLSGGEKQLLSLASVVTMGPELLLLDEPTSQLDPIAARRFFDTVKRLHTDFGITVILAEHRLEEVFSLASQVIALEEGKVIANGSPKEVCEKCKGADLFLGFPTAARIWNALSSPLPCPVNVNEGKVFVHKILGDKKITPSIADKVKTGETVISGKDLSFAYGKNKADVLRSLSLEVKQGEHLCILGGNGAGKSTLLGVLAGILPPFSGKVKIFGKSQKDYKRGSLYKNTLALLPQDPAAVFIKSTVREDFENILKTMGFSPARAKEEAKKAGEREGVSHLLDKNPLDLSGGERQKCALAKILLTRPKILFLDEPTKGLDAFSKLHLRDTIGTLIDEGKTVVTVTHDTEFAAISATRCALLFRGELIAENTPHPFFTANTFYTTAANRILPGAITAEEAVSALSADTSGTTAKGVGQQAKTTV